MGWNMQMGGVLHSTTGGTLSINVNGGGLMLQAVGKCWPTSRKIILAIQTMVV